MIGVHNPRLDRRFSAVWADRPWRWPAHVRVIRVVGWPMLPAGIGDLGVDGPVLVDGRWPPPSNSLCSVRPGFAVRITKTPGAAVAGGGRARCVCAGVPAGAAVAAVDGGVAALAAGAAGAAVGVSGSSAARQTAGPAGPTGPTGPPEESAVPAGAAFAAPGGSRRGGVLDVPTTARAAGASEAAATAVPAVAAVGISPSVGDRKTARAAGPTAAVPAASVAAFAAPGGSRRGGVLDVPSTARAAGAAGAEGAIGAATVAAVAADRVSGSSAARRAAVTAVPAVAAVAAVPPAALAVEEALSMYAPPPAPPAPPGPE